MLLCQQYNKTKMETLICFMFNDYVIVHAIKFLRFNIKFMCPKIKHCTFCKVNMTGE